MMYTCRNCVYNKTCGDYSRQEPCAGRMTKTDRKKMASSAGAYKRSSDEFKRFKYEHTRIK